MKHIKDFSEWSELNKAFSLYDYIFQVTKHQSLPEDLFFVFFELFWLSLCIHDGFVFIQEQYNSGKYAQLRDQNHPVDFTDHGRPHNHLIPHQHEHKPNPTGGTRIRDPEGKPVTGWDYS